MTTITQDVNDIAGVDDNTSWTFYTQAIRESDAGDAIISAKKVRKYPVAGVLTVELDPGPAVVLAADGKHYPFTVPDTDSQLWPLIQAAVTIPPSTTHQQLLDAVDAWLASHTDVWENIPDKPAVIAAGATAAEARAAIGVDLTDLDEWEWYANLAAFPVSGVTDVVYGARDTGDFYRWSGAAYVQISVHLDADGSMVANYVKITGGQSATTGMRFVGKCPELGPTAGTWLANDIAIDPFGAEWICVLGGTPGTWWNMSPGYMDQVATEFQYGATYIVGGPITLSSTPTTLPVADASRIPDSSPAGAKELVIGTGVVEGTPENRVLATYTGVSGNNLTGVVTRDGTTQIAANGLQVWYAKPGLRAAYLRIPNGIIARSGLDGRPHDLVLCAAYDDTRTIETGRADYDIVLTREAGSYSVCAISLPLRFVRDTPFTDGQGSALLTIAGGADTADTNLMNETVLPTGTLLVGGTLKGGQGAGNNLRLQNGGAAGRISLEDSLGVRKFSMVDGAIEVVNLFELRFLGNPSGFGAILITGGNRMTIRNAGAGGFAIVNSANTLELLKVSDSGVVTTAGAIELGHATDTTVSRTAAGRAAIETAEIITSTAIAAVSAKATPVDADLLPLFDSEASNAPKSLSWANLKATAKAYYDSVIATLTNKSIDLATNTLTGTTAQFNTALSDGDFATLAGAETLSAKTLTAPVLTGASVIPQSGTITLHNQIDQTTNYEKLVVDTSSNVFRIHTEAGGTGTFRDVQLGVGTTNFFRASSLAVAKFLINVGSSTAGIFAHQISAAFSAASGVQTALKLALTSTQTGTGGYTALDIDVTETSVGSGAKKLADLKIGGVSKFSVDNTGVVTAAPSAAAGTAIVRAAVPATATSTGTAGQVAYDANFFYCCTATNVWVRAALATW